ncbi:MAG: sugar ABC transporter permease [Actinomycetales bacterium]|nr:sugar ABC transporter permease [Actinomycetales bacterium]
MSTTLSRKATPWLFLAPALIVLGVFVGWPMVSSAITSLTDARIAGTPKFIGLDNYVALFSDPRFTGALGNTALYALGTAPISVVLALLFAVLLNRRIPGRDFFRAVLFFPFIVSLGIISIAWGFMLDPQVGVLTAWLSELGVPIGNGIRDPAWALPFVMVVGIWRNVGFFMVMYLAGLQSIPGELYEAAQIDGAGPWQRFRSITLPLLSNTSMFVVMVAAIFAFQAFDQIYVMTAGGPFFRTETMVMYIYSTAFQDFKMGYATAISWVLVLIVLALSLVQLRFFNRRTVSY